MDKCTFEELRDKVRTRTPDERKMLTGYQGHIKAFAESLKDAVNLAHKNGSNIKGFFDFDCDGIMSALGMTRMIPDIDVYIGDRYKDGYGIPDSGLTGLKEGDLVICGDMGSTEEQKIVKIKEITGNWPIIIDHHEVSEKMEKYPYMLNFNKKSYGIPMEDRPDWCTAGLVYQLAKDYGLSNDDMKVCNIYSALATIADVVKVNNPYDTNREDVKEGYKVLETENIAKLDPNLFYFLYNCGLFGGEHILTKTIQFNVNPVINAPGRIGTISQMDISGGQFMYETLNPYSSLDREESLERIMESIAINSKRKDMEKEASQSQPYLRFLKTALADNVLVCYLPDLDKGICGRIAQNLSSEYKRPAICFCGRDGDISGSARNYPGYPNMMEATQKIIDDNPVLKGASIGGHPDAFGFKGMTAEGIRELRTSIDRFYMDVVPQRTYEKAIDLQMVSIDNLVSLEPFGPDYPQPKADETFRIGSIRLMKNDYCKVYAENDKKTAYFGQVKGTVLNKGDYMHVRGDIQVNYYQDTASLQVSLDDYEISREPFKKEADDKSRDDDFGR